MKETTQHLGDAVELVTIQEPKFSTDVLHVMLLLPYEPEKSPAYCLALSMLAQSCRKYPNNKAISARLDHLYGLSIGTGTVAYGDTLRLTFSASCIADRYAFGGEALLREAAQIAADCGVDVANYNCPAQLIISGEADLLKDACEKLAPEAMKVVPLEVAGAYHSRLMRPAGDAFREYLATVPLQPPALPIVHNTTGQQADTEPNSIRKQLAAQVYSPVRWEECCRILMQNCDKLLELGPGQVLTGLARRIDRRFPAEATAL